MKRLLFLAAAGGKLAQVSARLIGGVVRQLAGKFFAAFGKRAGGGRRRPNRGLSTGREGRCLE
jgi:hypothetical protein